METIVQTVSLTGSSVTPDNVTVKDYTTWSCQIITTNQSGFSCDIKLEVSNVITGNYKMMTGSDSTLTGNDVQFYDITDSSASFCRVAFTNIAGTATATIIWVMK